MIEAEFRRLLHNGHGRAIQYAREHDVSGFRDLILDACLHCHAVDPICEGTRASYMYDLLELLPDRPWYVSAVLMSLPDSGDNWDAVQRFTFVGCLAEAGDATAK